jgi:iron(III) transport system substrate-binding protein
MDESDADGASDSVDRRRFLQGGAAAAGAVFAGCSSLRGTEGTGTPQGNEIPDVIGSGLAGRAPPGGTSMEEMPALSGELTVYSGRGEALVGELVGVVDDRYPDLTLDVRYGSSTGLVNQILTEGNASNADVFYSVNAGSLGKLAAEGRTQQLPESVRSTVREEFRDPDGQWVGTSGRARSVPYNTGTFRERDIPDSIWEFPERDRFADRMGWAPAYGSFQAFVTAMRVLNGEQKTKRWLNGMLDRGVRSYADEFQVAQAVADGELEAGFTNHYYVQRVIAGRDDPPIATAFTKNDAGAVFNVAGACVMDTADSEQRAANFVRHLLSGEAQDYFARTTFEYPLIPDVEPVGRLPTVDELNPPDLDLTTLSDLEPTIDLMRDVGLNV